MYLSTNAITLKAPYAAVTIASHHTYWLVRVCFHIHPSEMPFSYYEVGLIQHDESLVRLMLKNRTAS